MHNVIESIFTVNSCEFKLKRILIVRCEVTDISEAVKSVKYSYYKAKDLGFKPVAYDVNNSKKVIFHQHGKRMLQSPYSSAQSIFECCFTLDKFNIHQTARFFMRAKPSNGMRNMWRQLYFACIFELHDI